jgi:A/G-specific adenine glycosylase
MKSVGAGKSLAAFRKALLQWYDDHRRSLPWRETQDPYRIWVSEIMLQQTRVAAVLDYYRKFLEQFPNIQALAAASEDSVLATWSGLGYYRRARMLHQCAKHIVEKLGGRFPQNSEALLALPGIGPYTAAAVASIAFAEPVAVVDGNVERVLARVTGIDLTKRETWEKARILLDHSRPGDFNQAMMELGATVCVPRAPQCLVCPMRKWCATQGEQSRTEAPSRQQKKQIWCALDCRNNNERLNSHKNADADVEVRLVRRPKTASLMAGMWELPQSPESPSASLDTPPWRTFRHSITVTDYTVHVLKNASPGNAPFGAKGKWIATDRISQIPITGLTRKILKAGGII